MHAFIICNASALSFNFRCNGHTSNLCTGNWSFCHSVSNYNWMGHRPWLCFIYTFSRSLKFIYSEKATKFCKISTLLLSYVVPIKSKVEISQNFVTFSEYMNFKGTSIRMSQWRHMMVDSIEFWISQSCMYFRHYSY